jgi:phosphatidylglycerophosphatase A
MKLRDTAAIFLATGGYVGKIPLAPGTFGSLWGLPAAYLLSGLSAAAGLLAVGFFILAAIAVAHRAVALLASEDPGCVVIDEVAGMMITLLAIPFTARSAAIGFLLFRILDIVKPFPIRVLERRIPGGAGVVLDDVAAGVMANLLLRVGFAIGLVV